jgi:hypothetical protein
MAPHERRAVSLAVLVCHRSTQTGPVTVEFTYWDNTEQARQAELELGHPCGPLCIGIHSVVLVDIEPATWRSAGRAGCRISREVDR